MGAAFGSPPSAAAGSTGFAGCAGSNQTKPTMRSRSMPAQARARTWARGELPSRRTSMTSATGKPTGNTPPRPDDTNRSPTLMSDCIGRYGRVSASGVPAPMASVCRPLRATCTGMPCSGSDSRMISVLHGPTRRLWPMMPSPATTAWPLNTPLRAPRSTTIRWRWPSESCAMTCAGSQRSATAGSSARRPRSSAFSRSRDSRRIDSSCWARSASRRRRFSSCSAARLSKISRVQRHAATGDCSPMRNG